MSEAGPTIYPTHTCFDDVVAFLKREVRRGVDVAERYRIVHGLRRMDTGELAAHAWLEEPAAGLVIDFGLLDRTEHVAFTVERGEYYGSGILEATTYSLAEACRASALTGGSGPFKARYLRHTRDRAPLRNLERAGRIGRTWRASMTDCRNRSVDSTKSNCRPGAGTPGRVSEADP